MYDLPMTLGTDSWPGRGRGRPAGWA
eukprot:SAG31_NODE_6831_length_1875_cov_1.809685_1_plen_25_part_10